MDKYNLPSVLQSNQWRALKYDGRLLKKKLKKNKLSNEIKKKHICSVKEQKDTKSVGHIAIGINLVSAWGTVQFCT